MQHEQHLEIETCIPIALGDIDEAHVILAGCGRSGWLLAEALVELEIEFVVIELDHRAYDRAVEAGFPVLFGDAQSAVVLDAAGLERARLMVSTVAAPKMNRTIMARVAEAESAAALILRADSIEELEAIQADTRVHAVVQPEVEAGFTMLRLTLEHRGLESDLVLKITEDSQLRRGYLRRVDAGTL